MLFLAVVAAIRVVSVAGLLAVAEQKRAGSEGAAQVHLVVATGEYQWLVGLSVPKRGEPVGAGLLYLLAAGAFVALARPTSS